MALKADRRVVESDISYFMSAIAERGKAVTLLTGASGVGLDNAAMVAQVAADPSGYTPLGMLLCDVVNIDLTRYKLNNYKDEVQINSKVTIMKRGWATTNMVLGTPAAGAAAYVGPTGYFQGTSANAVANPWIGTFDTSKDEDGYARVFVNVPVKIS